MSTGRRLGGGISLAAWLLAPIHAALLVAVILQPEPMLVWAGAAALVLVLDVVVAMGLRATLEDYGQRQQSLQEALTALGEQLDEARAGVEQLQQRVAELAREDEATGALTHDAFLEELDHEIEAARRTDVPSCLLVLQPDGDAPDMLQRLAVAVRSRSRASDLVAILGDGQLAVLLNNTGITDATTVCESWVESLQQQLDTGVSAGLSELVPDRDKPEGFITRAQQALEHARTCGGRRLSVIDPGAVRLLQVV